MATTHTPAVVSVQFGNLDTFCEELGARGPNIEPVVRICQQLHQGQSDSHGPLPIEHVFGHVRRVVVRSQTRSSTPSASPIRPSGVLPSYNQSSW